MTQEYQAGKLMIEQIGMLNEATNLFTKSVEPEFSKALTKCMQLFSERNNWLGNSSLTTDFSGCHIAPALWNKNETAEDYLLGAYFEIDCTVYNSDFWIAIFCDQGSDNNEAGLILSTAEKFYGKRKAWNSFINTIDQEKIISLKKIGFKITDLTNSRRTFFLPITLDAAKLAETWGEKGEFNEADECFAPFREALEKIKIAYPIIDEILKNYSERA